MAPLATLCGHAVGPLHHVRVADFALSQALGQGREGVGDVSAHELPDHAEREGALAVRDVGALDPDEGEAVLFPDLHGVVGVFHRFETRHTRFDRQVRFIWVLTCGRDGVRWGFVDVAPVHAAGDYFIVGLQQDGAVFEVVEEGDDGRLDIERVEPEGEDAGLALAFRVEVFDFLLFFLRDRIQARVIVEEVGDEGEVEFRVAGYEGGWGEEFAAGWVEAVGVLQDLFGSLVEIGRLQWASRADVGCELVEEDGVVFAVFDVVGEILDSVRTISMDSDKNRC